MAITVADTASLILASASPRRLELLRQIGVICRLAPQDIDESPHAGESANALVSRLAREKAAAALQQFADEPGAIILASDTIVVVDDEVLGKPEDQEHARKMLAQLSGRSHRVLTAVTVAGHARQASCVSSSSVTFRAISEAEISRYWQTGEPCGKAGGYAIQGLGAIFVQDLQGSYSAVMGLPLYETAQLLAEFDISCWQIETE